MRLWFACTFLCALVTTTSCAAPAPGHRQPATGQHGTQDAALTLVPPSPVTDQVELELRGAVSNTTDAAVEYTVVFYWDGIDPATRIASQRITVQAGQKQLVQHRVATSGRAGERQVVMTVNDGQGQVQVARPITVLDAETRSTGRIGGAWLGFYHWSESEGEPWNAELKEMTDEQWKELVRAMHEVGMNIIVLQEVFRHEATVGGHDMTVETYPGRAFYPSDLYPGRMPIVAEDPIEAVLAEADRLGMHIFVGVGSFAWFDFGPESLRWHLRVADELWERYGHHESFYGWYISEEVEGGLSAGARDEPTMSRRHEQIVHFFSEFRQHINQYAPDKPVMLATNAHGIDAGEHIYPALLENLDILCPFGFHRMPAGDTTGEVSAARLQRLCDDAGSHLWMDMEIFDFGPNGLIPRPIDGLVDDLNRFPVFEKILCYQFPGLMNAPWMTRQPGGPETVELYESYKTRLEEGRLVTSPIDHLASGCAYRLAHEPSDTYPGEGESPLTDGWLGTASYQHQAWIGFEGDPIDLVLEISELRPIQSVEIGFLQDHPAGIYLPDGLRIGLSADGTNYRWIDSELLIDEAKPGATRRQVFKAEIDGIDARFIRVVSQSTGMIPAGHPAADSSSWMFIDEVMVR